MNKQDIIETIRAVLLKKAEGYFYNEEINEYQVEQNQDVKEDVSQQLKFDLPELNCNQTKKSRRSKTKKNKSDKLVLVKKKVTTHHIPPDLTALKMLMDLTNDNQVNDLTTLTDEELESLKNDIIKKLNEL